MDMPLFQARARSWQNDCSSGLTPTTWGRINQLQLFNRWELGTAIVRCHSLEFAAGKGTERDEEVMQMLLKGTDWTSCEAITPSLVDAATLEKIFPNGRHVMPDRTALFEVLSGAKNDPQFWGELSVVDCLRIDYKKFL
ncbi:hypothetical protein ACHAXR_000973, partial [Thalassiosira sp. AJA248-18]